LKKPAVARQADLVKLVAGFSTPLAGEAILRINTELIIAE